jgi:hypothetical protein
MSISQSKVAGKENVLVLSSPVRHGRAVTLIGSKTGDVLRDQLFTDGAVVKTR